MNNWINITDRMPTPGVPFILFCFNGSKKGRTLRCKWIPKYFMEDEENYHGDPDYNEAEDKYYWPQGYYEWNECEEIAWCLPIDYEPTHWQPLPESPLKKAKQKSDGIISSINQVTDKERLLEAFGKHLGFGTGPELPLSALEQGIKTFIASNCE